MARLSFKDLLTAFAAIAMLLHVASMGYAGIQRAAPAPATVGHDHAGSHHDADHHPAPPDHRRHAMPPCALCGVGGCALTLPAFAAIILPPPAPCPALEPAVAEGTVLLPVLRSPLKARAPPHLA